MLFSKLAQYGTRLALALILGLALVGSLPIPAQAQATIDLEIGGEGATSWNISNIKPGDSGTKTVELHNAGSWHGSVTIWISDIEEVDYAGDGAALDDYLLFNLSCELLSSNITLPVTISELPQSAADTNYVKINPLYAHETVTLVWEWEFPETGEPQNDAQGDSLSFTINYLLEELPIGDVGYGTPSYQQLEMDILGTVTEVKVSSSGEFLEPFVITDPDNRCKLEFTRGTKVTCASGKVPIRIEVKLYEESLSPPSGTEVIGPAYNITGYISDSVPCPLIFDQPVALTMSYDSGWLPEDTSSIFIASYGDEQGWSRFEPDPDSAAELGQIAALISHTSIFVILAELVPSSPVPSPPPASAEFELSELAINPAQTAVGEAVTISAIVKNVGGLEGSYTLNLEINGEIEQSQEITLPAGESRQVSFAVIKDDPGTYTIAVDGLSGEFIVLAPVPPPTSSPPESHIYWWIILIATGIIAPVVYFLAIRPRHHL